MKFKRPKFWESINFFSILFLPFALITLIYNNLKLFLITKYSFKTPIICVGNIFIGGTGKTPLSIYIYNLLRKKKFRPAIVRKYYSSHKDEINLTKDKVKYFFSGKNRTISILKAEQNKNDVIVMDDGLQDASIKKDLNIVCFNSVDTIGNGLLLPAGPLRDQLKELNDVQIVIINGKRNINFEKKLKQISKNIKIYQSMYKIKKASKYNNKKILAFAGIGSPENFFSLLKDYGFKIKDRISFPDHYNYSKSEIENIILRAEKNNLKLITTEKDYFRIKKLGFKKIDYVSVNLVITKYKSFEKDILNIL